MFTSIRIAGALLAVLAGTVIMTRFASAQDADTQEVQRYTLTDAGLAKYTQATQKLAALATGAGHCEDEDSESSQSIDDVVAKLKAQPGAQAAIQAGGMTPREYIVFSMSLLQNGVAAWALKQPGGKLPAGVSKANVDFVNRHEAEIKKLEGLSGGKGCDDRAAAEDERDTE
jgi:hypothetical protein